MYLTKQQLIKSINLNDDQWLAEIVEPIARSIAHKYFPSLCDDDQDDLVSASLVACWRIRSEVDVRNNPFSYITQKCHWSMLNELKKKKNQAKRDQQAVDYFSEKRSLSMPAEL